MLPSAPPRATYAVLPAVLPVVLPVVVLTLLVSLLGPAGPVAGATPAVAPTATPAEPVLPDWPVPGVPGLPGDEEDDEVDPRSQDFPSMPRRCATRAEQIPKTPMRCVLRRVGADRPTLVLWGDSHLWMMLPAVRAALRDRQVNLVGFLFGGCVPARPDMEEWAGQPCAQTADLANRYLARMTRRGADVRVVLGSFWGAQLGRVHYYPSRQLEESSQRRRAYTLAYTPRLFRWLGRRGIPTDVVLQGPVAAPPDPDCEPGPTPYGCDIPRYRSYYREDYLRGFVRRQMRHLPRGARLIDYSDTLCTQRRCRARHSGGLHTWYDPYHLSTSTTRRLGGLFEPSVERLAGG